MCSPYVWLYSPFCTFQNKIQNLFKPVKNSIHLLKTSCLAKHIAMAWREVQHLRSVVSFRMRKRSPPLSEPTRSPVLQHVSYVCKCPWLWLYHIPDWWTSPLLTCFLLLSLAAPTSVMILDTSAPNLILLQSSAGHSNDPSEYFS